MAKTKQSAHAKPSAKPSSPVPKKLETEVVVRLARGNVRLQLGCYRTAREIEKDRKRVLSYSF